jgi:hypothetical protein
VTCICVKHILYYVDAVVVIVIEKHRCYLIALIIVSFFNQQILKGLGCGSSDRTLA